MVSTRLQRQGVPDNKTSDPHRSRVTRRMILSLDSDNILEDLKVNRSTSEKLLYRLLPKGTPSTCTILYHDDGNVANMEVPTINSQRVATKPVTDVARKEQEPNYISVGEDSKKARGSTNVRQ